MNPISLLLKLPISSSLISSVDFPNNITCPLLGVSIVEIQLIKVVFPDPDVPITQINSPFSIDIEILFNEITGLSVISS